MNFAKGELLYVPLPRFILPELKETLVKFVRSCTKTFRHKLPTQTTINVFENTNRSHGNVFSCIEKVLQ